MRKRTASLILDIAIAAATAMCLHLLRGFMEPGIRRQIVAAAVSLPLGATVFYEVLSRGKPAKRQKEREPPISALVLLGERDRPIRVWDLTGKVGLLIGKGSDSYQVDIDLSGTDYHSFIDPEHALLNYHESGWWLQDASSRNGVSIVRKGRELLLGSHTPVRLEPGDVICIAQYTRIAVS